MGVGADGLAYRFHQQAMDYIGISAEDTLKIIADFALPHGGSRSAVKRCLNL